MEETVTFHSYSSELTDITTEQHFEVEQPESPQSHGSLLAVFLGLLNLSPETRAVVPHSSALWQDAQSVLTSAGGRGLKEKSVFIFCHLPRVF